MWRFAFSALALAACQRGQIDTAGPAEPVAIAQAPTKSQLQRGAYVARISGCTTCHATTRPGAIDMSDTLGGGYEGELASGTTWRAPNISPDRETGIGAWLPEQLVGAFRTGVRPDGAHLSPVMPYRFFHRMTDADAYALVAYLRSEIPVWHVVGPNARTAAAPGPELPPPTGNVDPGADDPRGHGEYLATLMHCAACHTASEGPTAGIAFAGGVRFPLARGGEVVAPNITSDEETGLGSWTEDQIIQAVRTMTRPDGRPIQGPMARYGTVWGWLSDADARALATYVKSIRPVRTVPRDPIDPQISSQP